MPNQTCNHAMPGLPHADIADLGRKITTLRERIVVMVHEGQQTRDLLVSLLKALKVAKTARALELARLSTPNSMHKPVVPVSTACRIR